MARSLALVSAVRSGGGAALLANFALVEAFVLVTRFDAFVASTGQWFGACKATTERALEARNRFSLFVFAVAMLGGQHNARRTINIRMAVVQNRVGTAVPSRARFVAMGFFRSTRHWWINDACSTLAG